MSRALKNSEPSPACALNSSATITPFGVIDFAENHMMQAAAGVVGGPPAYLEAHGIRYIPATISSQCESQQMDSLVSMSDMGLPHPSTLDSAAAPVSPRELNSRVDSRIRRFMSMQSPTQGIPREDPREMRSGYQRGSDDASVNDRLRNLRRECELAMPGARSGSLDAEATSARLRKLREDAETAGGIGAKAQARRSRYDY